MKCSSMQPPKGRKRPNESSARAASRICLSWTQRWAYPPFSWWGQKCPRNNCRSYTWRFINCTDSLGFLLENQCSSKRCCHPSKTTKGGRGKRHQQPQWGPIWKTPIPPEVVCLRKERKTAWWKEVWLQFVRPTKKHWPQWLPSKKR